MVWYSRKFYVFNVHDNWFSVRPGFINKLSIHSFNHVREEFNSPLLIKEPNYTVELDLTKSKEKILEDFSRTVKAQVRKSEEDGVICYFDTDISKFVQFFNEFAVSKVLSPETNERIASFGEALRISYAELDGQILAAHTYVFDPEQKIVRQMHSASKRFDENFDRNKIGRANKYLHYRDMLAFKDEGIEAYDFGGYTPVNSKEVIESLLQFKLDFGGVKKVSANYFTLPYYLLRTLYIKLGTTKN
ncbi:hypothetical protein [Flavihumibacter sp. UBA7668]|uniref:hypothetical protein n=1 Tax=Flavihumibacter sp. UBA7668 TaxID=1946542 RepID=UPI0025BF8454|nr:hypothetical protein [Flavihumibacter sp. UBA7668]